MKVAIVGAGISGLACAMEFEKKGIMPTIFEKNTLPGDSNNFNICMFNSQNNEVIDPIKYLKNQYNLELAPLSVLSKVTLNSPNNQLILNDSFGYIFRRGIENNSVDKQLLEKIHSKILLNTYIKDVKNLSKTFDYVIVATGNYNIAKSLNLCPPSQAIQIKIATIIGEFESGTLTLWFNQRFSKDYYAYLIPHSDKEANLILIVENISTMELEFYWKEFLLILGIDFKILEISNVGYSIKLINPLQENNIYFIGNSGGLTCDFLGYGVINAIESGIIAARCILEGKDYTNEMKPLNNKIADFALAREKLGNLEYEGYSTESLISRISGLSENYNVTTIEVK